MLKHGVVVAVAVVTALGAAKLTSPSTSTALANTAQVEQQGQAAPAAQGAVSSEGAAEVSKSADGHYWAEAEVNGRWMRCLIDTGATVVALNVEDARRLGLDPATLKYDAQVNTANGMTRAAQVELDHVSVAGARVDHVSALVVQSGLAQPLLGMSYLGRLSRFEATPTTLILRP
jgi:aspartyl protease family protein